LPRSSFRSWPFSGIKTIASINPRLDVPALALREFAADAELISDRRIPLVL
jgi:hypothetical protein